jgi:hypothetical protein
MVIAAVWGEFVSHDVSHTPQQAGHLGQRLKCCNVKFEDFHPECYPIKIAEDDPFYKEFGLQCQEYARSGTASRTGCTLGPREQINQVRQKIMTGIDRLCVTIEIVSTYITVIGSQTNYLKITVYSVFYSFVRSSLGLSVFLLSLPCKTRTNKPNSNFDLVLALKVS